MRTVCRLEDVDQKSGKEVVLHSASGPLYVALFRVGDEIHAYLNTCPHQGRLLNWAPDQFLLGEDGGLICPHHGACFETATGLCVSGPCEGASLTPVNVRVRDGCVELEVD